MGSIDLSRDYKPGDKKISAEDLNELIKMAKMIKKLTVSPPLSASVSESGIHIRLGIKYEKPYFWFGYISGFGSDGSPSCDSSSCWLLVKKNYEDESAIPMAVFHLFSRHVQFSNNILGKYIPILYVPSLGIHFYLREILMKKLVLMHQLSMK